MAILRSNDKTSLLRLQLQIPVLEYGAWFRRHHGTLRRLTARFEGIADLLHGHPFDAFFRVEILDDSVTG